MTASFCSRRGWSCSQPTRWN